MKSGAWYEPACSTMKLLRTGLSHSLHLTTPMSDESGCAPNSFMSFAESHEVGGDGKEAGSVGVGGKAGSSSHEKGVDGLLLGLSFSVIVVVAKNRFSERWSESDAHFSLSTATVSVTERFMPTRFTRDNQ